MILFRPQSYYVFNAFLHVRRNTRIDTYVVFYLSSSASMLSDRSLKKLCPSITDMRLRSVVSMLSRLNMSYTFCLLQ